MTTTGDDTRSPAPPPGSTAEGPACSTPERRVRELERALELALAELDRVHRSRWWALASRYWRLRELLVMTRQRVVHPMEGLRSALPALIPARTRTRLLRLLPARVRRASGRPQPVIKEGAGPAAGPSSLPAVICLPIIEWDFRMQRPQHLMTGLAARGWRVFYTSMRRPAFGTSIDIDPQPLGPNVYGIHLPSTRLLDPYRSVCPPAAADEIVRAFADLRRDAHIHAAIVVSQLPFWEPIARRLREAHGWPLLYDRMDDHAAFSTNSRAMTRQEAALIREADLVVSTSLALEESARALNPHTLRLPNACDYEHWAGAQASQTLPLPRPLVGYFGAVSEWFDSELVAAAARQRPEWSFVLVGSTYGADLAPLRRLSNVHLLGERPYALLPALVAQFDVGMIPFRSSPLTRATDPVKFYEMMAMGIPVVATPLPELERHVGLVRLAASPKEFVAALDETLAPSDREGDVLRRREFARRNRWLDRAERLDDAARGLSPRASIGVVSYNNLTLTKQCLASVFARTAYPSFEVIVVDNGSSDGTPEYLQSEARNRENLRVILNPENRGFPAASNQAFRAAAGEVLCFLNNDTVVAAGWLSALVRVLRRDPQVGLVGPVTNAIGNEARISVPYESVDEMPGWAERYTASHRDEVFPIPMLALFCAALRRDVWERVGELDERFELGMFEDDDLSRRIRKAGLRLVCSRGAFVHHWQRASFRLLGEAKYHELYEANQAKFREKWRAH